MNADALPLTAAAIARAAGGRVVSGETGRRFPGLSIDTRTLTPGQLFVALRGPRFDGHAFVDEALKRGAGGLVVETGSQVGTPPPVTVIEVTDTLKALQDLALHVRRLSGARVVAITGSVGKTTTKEAAATMLEARFRTIRNRGNLNNHIGLPLSLFELQGGAEVAVMELGMNHAGEIRRLVEIAEPDVRVWTNVGSAHLEFFGSEDAIADAKAEILEHAAGADTLVANADDDRVVGRIGGFPGRVLTFGIDRPADVAPVTLDDRGLEGWRADVRTPAGEVALEVPLAGRGHLANVLAAVAVATTLDVPLEDVRARTATLSPARHRGEVLRLAGDVVVIDDTYNASPTALSRLFEAVAADPGGRRHVAFLGEMLELGDASVRLHREAAAAAAGARVAALVAVGGLPARALANEAAALGLEAVHVETSSEAADLAGRIVRPGDLVVVKGSRGTRMERVVERLVEERS